MKPTGRLKYGAEPTRFERRIISSMGTPPLAVYARDVDFRRLSKVPSRYVFVFIQSMKRRTGNG
jgi:hypothetical protein